MMTAFNIDDLNSCIKEELSNSLRGTRTKAKMFSSMHKNYRNIIKYEISESNLDEEIQKILLELVNSSPLPNTMNEIFEKDYDVVIENLKLNLAE